MFQLIRRYPQLLLFGMLTAMFSGPGQTFLVSLFIPSMQESFGMSKTEIAGFYSMATLTSAMLLPFTGKLLDRIRLVWFTLAAGFLLATGCFVLSQSTGWLTVIIGFLMVRNLGQGTLTMISSTTMARVFGSVRGKALGISNLGYPMGEAIFPYVVSTWIVAHGWRSGWIFLGGLTLLFFSPAVWLLLRGEPHESARHHFSEKDIPLSSPEKKERVRDLTAKEVLRDKRLYVLLLPLIIPPAFLTALFFHQTSFIEEWKGWSIQVLSAGFVGFGIVRAVFSFLIGPAVDRWSARQVLFLGLIPFVLGMAALLWGKSTFWAFVYLCGAGGTMGIWMTVGGALYAEMFGTRYLGSIKGMMSSIIVLSTAIAPVAMGAALDAELDPGSIILVLGGFTLLGTVLAWWGPRIKPITG